MAIESFCSGCGQRLRVGDEHLGKRARCPACGTEYVVGGGSAASVASTPQPNWPGGSPLAAQEPAALVRGPEESPSLPPSFFAKTPNGEVYGPSDAATIERWTREGRLNPLCQVREGEFGAWVNLNEWLRSRHIASLPTDGSPAINPYADHSTAMGNPYAFQTTSTIQTDRSGIVLTMGIVAWASTCGCIYISWIFSVVGVVMARQEMAAYRMHAVRPESRTMTQIGFWLCVLQLLLIGILAGFFILLIIIGIINDR